MRLALLVPLAFALSLLAPAEALPAPVSTVAAVGFDFLPPSIQVRVGEAVEFKGVLLPHTVTTSASADDAAAGRGNDEVNDDEDPDTFSQPLPQGTSVF